MSSDILAVWLLALLLAAARPLPSRADEAASVGAWQVGRATFYGNEAWLWSIHKGSCGYGYLWQESLTGWDVAAMSDAHADFQDSCGRCYEVACVPMALTDGYGARLDRSNGVCRDPEASVVVRVVDACPCVYPGNQYSNKRWCCGDMPHYDLSVWTFEKLAPVKYGVIALRYRAVPCDHQPAKPAAPAEEPTPGIPPPPGAVNPFAERSRARAGPAATYSQAFMDAAGYSVDGHASSSSAQHSTPLPPAPPQASADASASSGGGKSESATASSSSANSSASASSSTDRLVVYDDALQSSFEDASWNVEVLHLDSAGSGADGSTGICAFVRGNGALTLRCSRPGAFQGKALLALGLQTGKGGAPDFDVNLSGAKGSCRPYPVRSLSPRGSQGGGYTSYSVPLSMFDFNRPRDGSASDSSGDRHFDGCGGNGSWDVSTIELRNPRWWSQWVCVDGLALTGGGGGASI